MRELRGVDRLQQVDGATRPVRQTATAHLDAGRVQALVLTVEGQVVEELVGEYPGEQAHIGHALLQHGGWRDGRDDLLGGGNLVDPTDVLHHLVARRPRRMPIRHLLADALAGRLGQGLECGPNLWAMAGSPMIMILTGNVALIYGPRSHRSAGHCRSRRYRRSCGACRSRSWWGRSAARAVSPRRVLPADCLVRRGR